MDLHEFFTTATDATATLIRRVTAEQLAAPTPCPDWDVRALITHLFAVNGQAKAMAAGIDVAADGSTPDPIGDDLTASYTASVTSTRAAFVDPAVHARTLATPMGPFDGRVVFSVTSLEHLIHGWDLATALGVDLPFDPVTIGYAWRTIEDMPQVFYNFRAWGAYAAPLAPHPDATPTHRLLAALGRPSH
jgi:uncharacterized protein (TIGR03086 family)